MMFRTPSRRTRRMLETNFFGMLRMSQAFAPFLKANGGGALLNVLSIAAWINGGANQRCRRPLRGATSRRAPAAVLALREIRETRNEREARRGPCLLAADL